ncbi:superoxide dismutase [Candidatus Hepatoplasma crinochetorum]|uniref:superoxide dismutase n=1 Tax=Candidatus Hepatoplasma crinochetorum TaxID=295596 RepID=UPI0030891E94|nr:MAG: superoxide dismutase [Mn/Fe] 2 [Candidatus Hepatoplasma crinochetorum]
MEYKRIKLPFKYDYLEPYMDKRTVQLHYENHHGGYERNLLTKIKDVGFERRYPTLEDLMRNYQKIDNPEIRIAVREFGGGLINHNFLWTILKPKVQLKDGNLKSAIEKEWGSFDKFKDEFTREVKNLFGSGWVWLVKRKNGSLKIIKTFNQDNPWFLKFTPIMAIDLWEHSYYLKYNSDRMGYLDNYWNTINWDQAEEYYNS